MSGTIKFDYYYGIEAEQFSFYRVPRLLIKDKLFKGLSSDAKLLYGLMLDRMSLSMKSGWIDDENRAYIIYTVDNIRDDLGCGKEKAIKVLAELDTNNGIGLVERIRRGLGKPDIIYVKNFVVAEEKTDNKEEKTDNKAENTGISTEVKETDLQRSEKPTSRGRNSRLQEVGKTDFRESENQTSRSSENRLQEVGESDPNYTNYNYTNYNQTDMNYINPINPINQSKRKQKKADSMDEMDDVYIPDDIPDEAAIYRQYLWEKLECDIYAIEDSPDHDMYRELFELINDIVCIPRESVVINGKSVPYGVVKSCFMQLTPFHLQYVIDSISQHREKISNMKNYAVTSLYNAPKTMNMHFTNRVNSDMTGGFT